MKVLIACEESQAVCKEFRSLGHEAYSCDIQPCSGGHPEWHIEGDVLPVLKEDWDIVIAFPPCTHLAVSGAAWFEEKRKDGRQQEGIDFFMEFTKLESAWAIENPIGIMSKLYRKPDQVIQPWMFGHPEQKATCLWLNNLPPLVSTNNVYIDMMELPDSERQRIHYLPPGPDRGKERSKTFSGIAKAMAQQWSNIDESMYYYKLSQESLF
jgi:hypothetical protein